MNSKLQSADAYQHKLNEAKRLFDIHNFLRKPTLDDTRVVYEEFLEKLVALGGTSSEMLRQITAEDLVETGVPILIARRLVEIFREIPSFAEFGDLDIGEV